MVSDLSTAQASPLTRASHWSRARSLKLHEHFCSVARAVDRGAKLCQELARVARMLNGMMIDFPGGPKVLAASAKTLDREWRYWIKGGRAGQERVEYERRPEALLLAYKPGTGGHRAVPRQLVMEFQRRMTLATGGRDKHGRSPISAAYHSIRRDFDAQRPLPGIDYSDYATGAEFPWTYRTFCRHKPSRGLRAAGNLGTAAHKGASAYVSMNYAQLRKCELYTLDDVRLDIVCIDEATGRAVEVVCYILMEVGSRSIVAYILKPAAAIKQEDVDELLAYGLQAPGFGIGVGYVTHILFERGAVACSDAAQMVIEGVTDNGVKVHRTSMIGGVRWIGSARDKQRGNAAGKAVIESFNRSLHFALLHLPGQRGNNFGNQPASLGDLGQAKFSEGKRTHRGSLIDEAEHLAQFNLSAGGRLRLMLPMLYLRQVDACVDAAIKRHNTEPGHDYRGHGTFAEIETAPGVWEPLNELPQQQADEPF